MTVESAADRAAFLSTDDFGQAAVFTPSAGSPVSLSVLLVKPSERMGVAHAGFQAPAYQAWARQDDIATDPSGGTLVAGAQTFTVDSAEQDSAAGFWIMDLVLQ